MAVTDLSEPTGGLSFSLNEAIDPMVGTFTGTIRPPEGEGPVTLTVTPGDSPRVIYEAEGCRYGAYQIALQLALDAPEQGVASGSVFDVLLSIPQTTLTLIDDVQFANAGVAMTDPAMGDEDVRIVLTHRFDDAAWSGQIAWRFDGEDQEPEGTLATWSVAP